METPSDNHSEEATSFDLDLETLNSHSDEPAFELDLDTVQEEEKRGCGEFFLGRANKTPERYMRIRNHMVTQWNAIRPQYLTKIKARADLRNCGDVNAIGRVHAFLEAANIINAGAVVRPRQQQQLIIQATRKRRTPQQPDDQMAEGGTVIEHHVVERWADDAHSDNSSSAGSEDAHQKRRGRRRRRVRRRRSSADYSDGGGIGSDKGEYSRWANANGGNSEFRLVPCHTFGNGSGNGSGTEAPFTVTATAAALALMDLHAHLMYTEIIGLLGGRYDEAARALHIDVAFPCHNISSSTTECEMDPVSEVEARRAFGAAGQSAVGWYHSHPTFDAVPSVRDMLNQRTYQDLCRCASSAAEPFVGLIVSPPGSQQDPSADYGVSDISAFCVADTGAGDVPFAVPYSVRDTDRIPDGLVASMAQLVQVHATMAHRADLSKRFRRSEAMTTLEKLVISMRSRWAADARQQWDDDVSLHLRPLIQKHFKR
ncbi:hypothetical protein EV175_000223 [Coemansia sp. RSA 1933]|nr:hypothetical protein EV175_000223 [Coemansia sp. RSA 1933]